MHRQQGGFNAKLFKKVPQWVSSGDAAAPSFVVGLLLHVWPMETWRHHPQDVSHFWGKGGPSRYLSCCRQCASIPYQTI